MKICHFRFRMIDSMPKILDLNTLTLYFNFFHSSCITQRKGDLSSHHAMNHFHAMTQILLLFDKSRLEKRTNHASLSHHYANYFAVSRIMTWKKWPIAPSRQTLVLPPILAPILRSIL